jgi:hypothetical protein
MNSFDKYSGPPERFHRGNKPYFRNPNEKFMRGRFKGTTYATVWTYFPEEIEWLILNYELVIDPEEFEKINNKKISGTAKERLNLHENLIGFNRKKNVIRQEWKNNQEQKLPIINGKAQFNEDYKEELLKVLFKNYGFEINKVSATLDLLGITINDIKYIIRTFQDNEFNTYRESFFGFLHSCIYWGCGKYFKKTKIQFDEEILNGIGNREITEIAIPSPLPNYDRLPQEEILEIDDDKFIIRNTNRNAKKDGVYFGKIYAILDYKTPKTAYNWFDFNSSIEGRVDILLNVECSQRYYQNK